MKKPNAPLPTCAQECTCLHCITLFKENVLGTCVNGENCKTNYSWKFETTYDRKFKQDPNNFRVRSFLSNRKQRVRIGNSKNKLPTSKWWRPTENCPRSHIACLCIMSMIFGKRLGKRVEICR